MKTEKNRNENKEVAPTHFLSFSLRLLWFFVFLWRQKDRKGASKLVGRSSSERDRDAERESGRES